MAFQREFDRVVAEEKDKIIDEIRTAAEEGKEEERKK